MKRILWCSGTMGLLALAACQSPQQKGTATAAGGADADRAAIEAVLQRELAAARANNPDSFLVLMAADATVKPPNEQPARGPAVHAWLQNMFSNATINQITYSDDEISLSGDLALHSHGFDWTVTPKGGQAVQERGHGIHVLQRQADGSWKIKYDMWSPDSPTAPAR